MPEFIQGMFAAIHDNVLIAIALVGATTAVSATVLEILRNRRERDNLLIERRRLAEVNIGMTPALDVTAGADSQQAFVILRLPFQNLGDGPVDMLGVLVSARLLTSPGEGTGSRDVGWADYRQLPWNHPTHNGPVPDLPASAAAPQAGELLRGLSTTRLLTVSADQYPRLAVGENLELLRVEAVINHATAPHSESAYLMHRVFSVVRGYTLGEILRQLGGRPRDPLRSVRRELLQFQPLAQPNYFRWSQVQKALFNINRFAFRLATGEADPLGLLCSPDAWRLFLLHHWDFIDEAEVSPESCAKAYRYEPLGVTTTIVKQHVIATWYPDQVLPNDWHLTPQGRAQFAQASAYCREQLRPLVERWERLKDLIKEAEAYRPGQKRMRLHQRVSRTFDVPQEWYPQLIHRRDQVGEEHRQRWLALMREGYLVSRPMLRPRWKRLFQFYTTDDIPPDPRVLEPYIMRTRFFLAAAHLDLAGAP